MTKLTDAEVRDGVTETLLDYCQLLDEKKLDAFADLFTEDAIFEEGKIASGRAHIRAKVRKLLNMFTALSHHLSNSRITRTGDETANAVSYIYAWHQLQDGSQMEIWGRYVDELRYEGDRWRFTRRQVQMQGHKGGGELPIMRVPQDQVPA